MSQANAPREPGFWPALFREKVAANARFWLDQTAVQQLAMPSLASERENIVKALARALQLQAAWEPAIDLLLAFHPYMARQGALSEWQRFVEIGLDICRQQGNAAAEAALLDRLGEQRRDRGDWSAAAALHDQAQRLSAAAGDAAGRARSLTNLGHVYRLQRRYAEAREVLQLALEICLASQNLEGQAFAHTNLGLGHYEERRWEQALHH
ncbi:MAG: tetratricopeptide repeat protein, partial [Anaerolineae bacterium]|nr:tetratricopeptide repeat protein [Anaerolineae bacterium]